MWPRTDPAMIVLVHDGVPGPDGRCLLGNNAAWPGTPDGAAASPAWPATSSRASRPRPRVVREVARGGRHPGRAHRGTWAARPWPFPGSLMLGFLATANPAEPVRVDPTEIAYARWFSRREIGAALAGRTVDVGDGPGWSCRRRRRSRCSSSTAGWTGTAVDADRVSTVPARGRRCRGGHGPGTRAVVVGWVRGTRRGSRSDHDGRLGVIRCRCGRSASEGGRARRAGGP